MTKACYETGSNIKKVVCENPDSTKQATRIDRWKYDLVRRAILKEASSSKKGVAFKELSGLVKKRLKKAELKNLGSVTWYTVVVKLDLEAKGLIERIPGKRPQVIRCA